MSYDIIYNVIIYRVGLAQGSVLRGHRVEGRGGPAARRHGPEVAGDEDVEHLREACRGVTRSGRRS